jgi:hypothetical protein
MKTSRSPKACPVRPMHSSYFSVYSNILEVNVTPWSQNRFPSFMRYSGNGTKRMPDLGKRNVATHSRDCLILLRIQFAVDRNSPSFRLNLESAPFHTSAQMFLFIEGQSPAPSPIIHIEIQESPAIDAHTASRSKASTRSAYIFQQRKHYWLIEYMMEPPGNTMSLADRHWRTPSTSQVLSADKAHPKPTIFQCRTLTLCSWREDFWPNPFIMLHLPQRIALAA